MRHISLNFENKKAVLNIGNNTDIDFDECLWIQTNLPSSEKIEEVETGDMFKIGNSVI